MISPGEATHLRRGVAQGRRNDGRSLGGFRPLSVDAGLLPLCHGSARACLGDGTDCMASVKVEVVRTDKDPPETLVEVHVEASPIFFLSATGAPAGHLGTDAATARLAAMGEVLQAVYGGANAVDVEKLEIVPGKFAWMVYVDVLLMRDSGNALDAAAAAVYTAMQVARIPATMPVLGEREEIDDFDIVHRTEDAVPLPFKLDADSLPLCITLARIGERFVVDPTDEEERCALTQLVVAVSQGGDVRGIHKLGGEPLAVDALLEFVDAAKAAASGLFPCLKHVVVAAAEDTARDEPVLRPNLGLQFGR